MRRGKGGRSLALLCPQAAPSGLPSPQPVAGRDPLVFFRRACFAPTELLPQQLAERYHWRPPDSLLTSIIVVSSKSEASSSLLGVMELEKQDCSWLSSGPQVGAVDLGERAGGEGSSQAGRRKAPLKAEPPPSARPPPTPPLTPLSPPARRIRAPQGRPAPSLPEVAGRTARGLRAHAPPADQPLPFSAETMNN